MSIPEKSLIDISDYYGEEPARKDGVSTGWSDNHRWAAAMYAQNLKPRDISPALGITAKTISAYKSKIEGFDELIQFYRKKLFEGTAEDAIKKDSREMLEVLKTEATEGKKGSTRISAAKAFLKSSGFMAYSQRVGEILAEQQSKSHAKDATVEDTTEFFDRILGVTRPKKDDDE